MAFVFSRGGVPLGGGSSVLLCCCLFVVNLGGTLLIVFLALHGNRGKEPNLFRKAAEGTLFCACLGLAADTGSVVASSEALGGGGSSCDDTRSFFVLAITLCPSSLE